MLRFSTSAEQRAKMAEAENRPQLRQDPITRDWVIINPRRTARPHEREDELVVCPFCPGNEHLTTGAVDSLFDRQGEWQVRTVSNKFPALQADRPPSAVTTVDSAGWRHLDGYGYHEVIIETPDHDATIGTLPVEQLRRILTMYARRYRTLATRDSHIRQIVLFRNHGRRAGTSLLHPHSQIIATPVVAPRVRQRMAAEIASFDSTGYCGQCQVVERELVTACRIIHHSACFVAVAPYAPQAAYHMQIVPLRHCPSFTEISEAELDDLAEHLSCLLAALYCALDDPDYNLVLLSPPIDQIHRGANHWFIDVLPRLSIPAGFELGSGISITGQAPEAAASRLRAECADFVAKPPKAY